VQQLANDPANNTMPRPSSAAGNLYLDTAKALRALIVERRLRLGDRLPSERALAQQLHVGRPVVRDALRILETQGLIGVSARQGSYLKEPDLAASIGAVADSVARSLVAQDGWQENLLETRRILETEAAALAAERATPEDVRALSAAADRLREGVDDADAFRAAEQEFCFALARAGRNPILAGLAKGLVGLCESGTGDDPAARREIQHYYQAAAAAIAEQQPARAREALAHRPKTRTTTNGHPSAA
jgi:DNA-binding FadR family transcriptional regulator